MKKSIFRITFFVIMTFFLVSSVSSQQKPPRFEKPGIPGLGNGSSSWTVMVYLDGDNSLESAAVDDFLKMAAAGSTEQVHVVAQFDRIDGFDTRFGNWTGTKRFYISKGLTPTNENAVMNVGEVNMADPANLVDFLYWAKTNYPAENYALLMWHHGNGRLMSKAELWQDWMQRKKQGLIFKDLCRDDTSGSDSLDIGDVRKALHSGGGAQLIGFAGSVTGMIEAAYEIKDFGEIMVGHGEIEPRGGWPFDTIISDLSAYPSWNALKFGSAILDRYYETYGSSATQSAVDLSKMDSLVGKVRAFAEEMVISRKSGRAAVSNAADNLLTGIKHTVTGERHKLPIYFPVIAENFDPAYNGLKINFPGAGLWGEFLQTFYRSMEAYEKAFDKGTTLVLSPNSDFMRFFGIMSTLPVSANESAEPAPRKIITANP